MLSFRNFFYLLEATKSYYNSAEEISFLLNATKNFKNLEAQKDAIKTLIDRWYNMKLMSKKSGRFIHKKRNDLQALYGYIDVYFSARNKQNTIGMMKAKKRYSKTIEAIKERLNK